MVKINENKASLYLVAIVGVVAAVGIIVLLMGSGLSASGDYTGQVIAAKKTEKTGTTSKFLTTAEELKKQLEEAAALKEEVSTVNSGGVDNPCGTKTPYCCNNNPDCPTLCCK